MATRKIKRIKLQSRYRELSCGQKIVPWLNISGLWLEKLGFEVGDMVSITTREKLLIIEPLEKAAQTEQEYKRALEEVKQTLKRLAR